jgi:hypothetical protein
LALLGGIPLAVRIRSHFHRRAGERSMPELASVVAALGWTLSQNAIRNMRKADFDIDVGRPYFDFVCEYLAFVVHVTDRIAHRMLDADRRVEFTTALARRLAGIIEDNREMLIAETASGECQRHFVALVNERAGDYAEFGYDEKEGPDFAFCRYFASCLLAVVPKKDHTWLHDQVMDIEAPDAVKTLQRTLEGLFTPVIGKGNA